MKKLLYPLAACALMGIHACNVSTANLSGAKMCESSENDECAADTVVFNQKSPEINMSVNLNNAPEDTKVKFAIYYSDSAHTLIGEHETKGSTYTNSILGVSFSKPEGGWTVGNYEAEMKITTDSLPLVKKFTVIDSWEIFDAPDYSIQYPSSWDFEKGTGEKGEKSFTIWSPEESEQDTIYEKISLFADALQDTKGTSLNDWVETMEPSIKEDAVNHSLKESKRIKTDSAEYHLFLWMEEVDMKGKKIIVESGRCFWLVNDILYSLLISGEPAKFEKHKTTMDKIINSFTIKK